MSTTLDMVTLHRPLVYKRVRLAMSTAVSHLCSPGTSQKGPIGTSVTARLRHVPAPPRESCPWRCQDANTSRIRRPVALCEGGCPAASPWGIWWLRTISPPAGFRGISCPGLLSPPTWPRPTHGLPAHCASSARRRRNNSLLKGADAGARRSAAVPGTLQIFVSRFQGSQTQGNTGPAGACSRGRT